MASMINLFSKKADRTKIIYRIIVHEELGKN